MIVIVVFLTVLVLVVESHWPRRRRRPRVEAAPAPPRTETYRSTTSVSPTLAAQPRPSPRSRSARSVSIFLLFFLCINIGSAARAEAAPAIPAIPVASVASDTAKLMALAVAMPGATLGVPKTTIAAMVTDIVSVTSDDTEQRFLLAWGFFESWWGSFNLGDCTCWTTVNGNAKVTKCPNLADRHVGNCRSFGVMQTQHPEHWIATATPAKVIVDRRLGLRVGLAIFRFAMKSTKGDVRAALRLYSSGRVDRAFEKVEKRCKWVHL